MNLISLIPVCGHRLKFRAVEITLMSQEGTDTKRTSVKTYIPAYQREEWERHAEELDMSQSEFVRTMVQAGRRSFDDPASRTGETAAATSDSRGSTGETGVERGLEEHVIEALAQRDTLSWEELREGLTHDIEQRLESALDRLQHENVIQYAGRHGGYTLIEENGD